MRARLMLSCAVALAGAGLSLGGGRAFGYAGEQGTVGTNVSPATVSTHHLHLTRALAYCAGFEANLQIVNPVSPTVITQGDARDAETIAMYDELTDQGTIRDGTTTWTNITPTWSYVFPPPETADCRAVAGTTMVYPLLEESPPSGSNLPADSLWNQHEGWFTNRFGPWAANFHFAKSADLQTMYTFAMMKSGSQTLSARTVYGFGPANSNMWTGTCYTPEYQTTLNTGMDAGSLQALGTYLHSLGDSYSHGVCEDNYPASYVPPWYYHTQEGTPQNVAGCEFNSHALEFGCPVSETQAAFERNVVDGGLEIFKKLSEYATRYGRTPRLKTADAHQKWLQRQLERYATLFKTNTVPEGGTCRVNFAHDLMQICTAAATTAADACLADVAVNCGSTGQVGPCTTANYFPITAPCSTAKATR